MKSILRKIIFHVSVFTIIAAAFLLGYLYYLSFWPIEVVKLNSFTVLNPIVKRGEYLDYNLDFVKLYNAKPKVTYFLVDSLIFQIADSGVHKPLGYNNVTSSKYIPLVVPAGKYKLRIELEYEITSWRKINYTWESNQFVIE